MTIRGAGVKELDSKFDLIEKAKQLSEDGVDQDTIAKIQQFIRGYNGNTLLVLHLLWIGGIVTQKEIAETLGISPARVSKIINNDLAKLEAYIRLSAEMSNTTPWLDPAVVSGHGGETSAYRATQGNWVHAKDVIFSEGSTDYSDGNFHSGYDKDTGGQSGSNISLRHWEGAAYRDFDCGSTNGKYDSRKRAETMIREALEEKWKDDRKRERQEAREAKKNEKSLPK